MSKTLMPPASSGLEKALDLSVARLLKLMTTQLPNLPDSTNIMNTTTNK